MTISSTERTEAKQLPQPESDEQKYWQGKPLFRLIAFIVNKHHYCTRQELARLDRLLRKVCSIHAQKHPELLCIKKLFRKLNQELMEHLLEEEQILFPYILRLDEARDGKASIPKNFFGKVKDLTQITVADKFARELLREIRSKSSDFTAPPDASMSYQALYKGLQAFERDLYEHIHLENHILFPRALEIEISVQHAGRGC